MDKNEQPLKAGATATHDFLGDCSLRGTVPIAGGGVNVTVDWLGPGRGGLPPSVGTEHLVLKFGLVGSPVYMRWETYGWQLGRITDVITSATPRLAKKFNYRIMWADGSKGPAKLAVDNYAYGTHARLNSWVILVPSA